MSLWDTIKRVRATVKGAYGDDSSEYELVGGTRVSEHRRPARRPPGEPALGAPRRRSPHRHSVELP